MSAAVPAPSAWYLTQTEAAVFAARGDHCDVRGCREPVRAVTHRWFTRDAAIRLAEHLVCAGHGEAFARRHHIDIAATPAGAPDER